MTGALSPTHWAIILVVVLLLFGAKRLPDAARGLGKSMRIFKAETASLTNNDEPGGRQDQADAITGPAGTESRQADPAQAEPAQAEPAQAEPARADPRPAPAHTPSA